jgi:beta-phosphoglucomutase
MVLDLFGYKGFIFDLDGVVVDTRPYHFAAWQRLATELDIPFDEQTNEILRGLSRMKGLEKLMEWGGLYASEAEKMFWADRKNQWYIELITRMTPSEVLPGVLEFLVATKERGHATALVSSSANARKVLQSTGLDPLFDVVIDGTIAKKSKPAPDCFLFAAHGLGLVPNDCIVFEDAPVGIVSAQRGGFSTVAVGMHRDLCHADHAIKGFEDMVGTFYQKKELIHSASE